MMKATKSQEERGENLVPDGMLESWNNGILGLKFRLV